MELGKRGQEAAAPWPPLLKAIRKNQYLWGSVSAESHGGEIGWPGRPPLSFAGGIPGSYSGIRRGFGGKKVFPRGLKQHFAKFVYNK